MDRWSNTTKSWVLLLVLSELLCESLSESLSEMLSESWGGPLMA
jgi:hypothetical protein